MKAYNLTEVDEQADQRAPCLVQHIGHARQDSLNDKQQGVQDRLNVGSDSLEQVSEQLAQRSPELSRQVVKSLRERLYKRLRRNDRELKEAELQAAHGAVKRTEHALVLLVLCELCLLLRELLLLSCGSLSLALRCREGLLLDNEPLLGDGELLLLSDRKLLGSREARDRVLRGLDGELLTGNCRRRNRRAPHGGLSLLDARGEVLDLALNQLLSAEYHAGT